MFGCFENNEWLGEADRCTNHKDEASCEGPQTTSCGEGTCSGTATDGGKNCSARTSGECNTASGCTWAEQCCKWINKTMDLTDTCMSHGKGTMDGVCKFHDGVGPPGKDIVQAGFEHSFFTKKDNYTEKCALVASFRNGSGSATALGANKKTCLVLRATTRASGKGWLNILVTINLPLKNIA